MKLSRTQRAALEKLADGQWHSLAIATNTVWSLHERKLVENMMTGSWATPTADYRITDAGRAAMLDAGK